MEKNYATVDIPYKCTCSNPDKTLFKGEVWNNGVVIILWDKENVLEKWKLGFRLGSEEFNLKKV